MEGKPCGALCCDQHITLYKSPCLPQLFPRLLPPNSLQLEIVQNLVLTNKMKIGYWGRNRSNSQNHKTYREIRYQFYNQPLRKIDEDLQRIHLLQFLELEYFKTMIWASLMAQWQKICLPMQGTWAGSLIWKDSVSCRATKPMCHNHCACAPEPRGYGY